MAKSQKLISSLILSAFLLSFLFVSLALASGWPAMERVESEASAGLDVSVSELGRQPAMRNFDYEAREIASRPLKPLNTEISPTSGIYVTKTVGVRGTYDLTSTEPMTAGEGVTFTIAVTSTDGVTTSLLITDSLHDWLYDLGYVSAELPTGWTTGTTASQITATGTITGVGGGSSAPAFITYTATVSNTAVGGSDITNTVKVSAAVASKVYPVTPVTLTMASATLEITKTAVPTATTVVTPNDTITYTIDVHAKDSAVSGYTITDTIDTNVNFVTATLGVSGPGAGNVITWTGDLLTACVQISKSVVVTVARPLDDGTVLTNTVEVSGTGAGEIGTDSITHTVQSEPEITAAKTAEPGSGYRGDVITFTIVMTNTGTEDIPGSSGANATLSDPIPDNTAYESGSESTTAGDVEYIAATERITWTGPLTYSQPVTVRFAVKARWVEEDTTITNTATISQSRIAAPISRTATVRILSPPPVGGVTYAMEGSPVLWISLAALALALFGAAFVVSRRGDHKP